MADYKNLFADEDFIVEHLFDSPENADLIQSFSVGNAAMGLEIFLKESSASKTRSGLRQTLYKALMQEYFG